MRNPIECHQKGLWYLASPYTHREKEKRVQRFEQTTRAMKLLYEYGWIIFSPITHSHPLAELGLGIDWKTWEVFDKSIMTTCKGIIVLQLEGWEDSAGIRVEVDYMVEYKKRPALYMEPNGYVLYGRLDERRDFPPRIYSSP
jgi:hypothetical protein